MATRTILRLGEEGLDEIRHIIQMAIIEDNDAVGALSVIRLGVDADNKTDLVVLKETDFVSSPITLADKSMIEIAKLLQFSLMTKTNFMDLLSQIRFDLKVGNVIEPTEEYLTYFDNIVKMRLKFAEEAKSQQRT